MGRKNKVEVFIFAAAVLVFAWIVFFIDAPYRLDFKEQISIFLLDADRLCWYLRLW